MLNASLNAFIVLACTLPRSAQIFVGYTSTTVSASCPVPITSFDLFLPGGFDCVYTARLCAWFAFNCVPSTSKFHLLNAFVGSDMFIGLKSASFLPYTGAYVPIGIVTSGPLCGSIFAPVK